MLTNLPDDLISNIAQFLNPCDFYNVKTVIPSNDSANRLFWWNKNITFNHAVSVKCTTLVRWIAATNSELSISELLYAARTNTYTPIDAILFNTCRDRWSHNIPDLLCVWVEIGNHMALTHAASCLPVMITLDVIDQIYLYARWDHLALCFQFAPRSFIQWIFGDYSTPADPEIIQNLRFIFQHLDPKNRKSLIIILNKYHEWLWKYKTTNDKTLATIVAIHSLEFCKVKIVPFLPDDYTTPALSAHPDYLEYLILCGLQVEPDLLYKTHDVAKLKLLMDAQIIQKYQKIMVMIFILIVVLVMGMILPNPQNAQIAERNNEPTIQLIQT